jgi:hypothetical protein
MALGNKKLKRTSKPNKNGELFLNMAIYDRQRKTKNFLVNSVNLNFRETLYMEPVTLWRFY